jgi:hypothetical protein
LSVGISAKHRTFGLAIACALAVVLLAAWWAYYPGLDGSYLFDDYINLNALGITGPVDGWAAFARYITSGIADPLGRPITLLTFLLDSQNWPAEPYSFKRTNVLLHLLNAVLLFWATAALGRRVISDERHRYWSALLSASIWLVHPLFVSTTLYIVQREAMLPATFTFIGLIGWTAGRNLLDEGKPRRAIAGMIFGSLVCTGLAALSKANGLLLPLLIFVAEVTVLRSSVALNKKRPVLFWCLLALPAIGVVAVLAAEIPRGIQIAADMRPWTLGQRLLTEPRVLVDYLRLLWIPRSTSFGLFNDQIRASTGWLDPWTTIPCLLAVVGLIVAAWLLRNRMAIMAFSILFFFAGHVMESSVLPLELAFEHRNYLPAAFMFWLVAVWLTGARGRVLRVGVACTVLVLLVALTRTRSDVWGDIRMQALLWAQINPDSARAQAFAGSVETVSGHPQLAIRDLKAAIARMPDEPQLTLNLVDAECTQGELTPETWQAALYSLRNAKSGPSLIYKWLEDGIGVVQSQACKGLTLRQLDEAIEALQSNTSLSKQKGRPQDAEHAAGELALAHGDAPAALEHFNLALTGATDRGLPLGQAAQLGSAGFPALGLAHLDFAKAHEQVTHFPLGMSRLHDWVLRRQGYWEHEFGALRQALVTDAATKHADDHP